jgi:hypothetical protein
MSRLNLIDEIANVYVPFNTMHARRRPVHPRRPTTPREGAGRPRRRWTAGLGALTVVGISLVWVALSGA